MKRDLSWLKQLPGSPLIVAEIKQRSPYGWSNPLKWERQLDICEEVGDIISVHTDPMWGGSLEHLAAVRKLTRKPILAKGFHPTIAHVRAALEHSDYCLTVGWWPGNPRCWHEVTSLREMHYTEASHVVWNSRDPRTGETRPESESAVQLQRPEWLCWASNVRAADSLKREYSAVLIGEGLYQ